MMFFNLLQIDKKKSKCLEKNTNLGKNAKIGVHLPHPPPLPHPLLIFLGICRGCVPCGNIL